MKVFAFICSILFISGVSARSLQLMSYNVENLFDAKHDEGKKDWTFLAKNYPGKKDACNLEKSKHRRKECLETDWTEKKLEFKLNHIAEVVSKDRALPDFLGLVEVENSKVVTMLAKKLGYESFEVSESPDERGVDVALLFKTTKDIKKISKLEHVVQVEYPTRNILEVQFLIDDIYPLTIFVNHWPSLANPDSWRIKAAEVLAKRSIEILAKSPGMSILAMGDFNTIDDNTPHPFKTVLCKDNLFTDINKAFQDDKSIDEKLKKARPAGTYYYPPKDQWNELDHFFVSKNLIEGKDLKVELKTFEIYAPRFITHQLKRNSLSGDQKLILAPKRFEPEGVSNDSIGYSDHFPIVLELSYQDKEKVKKRGNKKIKK